MKALLSRFNRGYSRDKDKERDKDKDVGKKEKGPRLPPLPEWPPNRPAATPNSIASFKPLPDLTDRPLPPIDDPAHNQSLDDPPPTPGGAREPLSPSVAVRASRGSVPPTPTARDTSHEMALPPTEPDSTGRSSGRNLNGKGNTLKDSDVQKKVAFISPPPSPGPSAALALAADVSSPPPNANASTVSVSGPQKSVPARFQAVHGKDPRGSTSTAASSSRTEVGTTSKASGSTVKLASTRSTTSPYPPKGFGDAASMHQSMRSGTPYSQMSGYSSRILAVQSWSEAAEEDLVSNLGPRERTRQEVLWEIVASEERYVAELQKMKDTFIEPLLHPYSASSPVSTPMQIEYDDYGRADSPVESLDHLPIAARFLSPTGFRSDTPATRGDVHQDTPNIDGESLDSDEEYEGADQMGKSMGASAPRSSALKQNHPRSPYGSPNPRSAITKSTGAVPFPSRSHQSLPPPPRGNANAASTHSLGQHSFNGGAETPTAPRLSERKNSSGTTATGTSRVLRKFKKSNPTPPSMVSNGAVPLHQLPEDLKKCLEVIETAIFEGHTQLSKSLRKRYDEQYPLVRSLADVFVAHSHILHGYATYVLHLERALEQVDNALSTGSPMKKPKKQNPDDWLAVCRFLQKLEENAAEKGETGMAISLSKPFQRLLKYPLLFQNLLFHTDPSTFEYESTLQMVAEVETIVRSIEDEKIQKEDRDKTRDIFARIEGLDRDKALALPKPSRLLVEERQLLGIGSDSRASSSASPPPPTSGNPRAVKGKTSFKRLSDVLQAGSSGVGGKKDLWLVVFNDVVLRCQRTGTTSLPLVVTSNSRTTSLPDLQGKAKYATTGRRHSHTKPRNLYRFLKIETWAIGDVMQPREGIVAMEDVARTRSQVTPGPQQPRIVPMPDDNSDEERAADSDDSDRKSKMSFSYWGADKVTLQKPPAKIKPPSGSNGAARRLGPAQTTAYGRESSANAKFGTRLLGGDSPTPGGTRPASRRTQATPTSRRPTVQSEDSHAVRVTTTRPAWGSSTTRSPLLTPQPSKRPRNSSQPSVTPVRATVTAKPQLASPAPSEDSGVGLYRQMMANDPSINGS